MCMYLILGKPLKVRPTTICIEVVLLTMPRTCWSTQITLKYHLECEGLQKFIYNVLTLDLATLNWVTQYNLQQPHPHYSHLFQAPVTLRLYISYIFNTATSLSHSLMFGPRNYDLQRHLFLQLQPPTCKQRKTEYHTLYSRKYWWELNWAVGPQFTIAKILVDFNLVVR